MKSTKDVRDFLITAMEKAADGEIDIAATKCVTNLAQQIYNTLNLELKVAVAKEKYGQDLSVKPVDFDG